MAGMDRYLDLERQTYIYSNKYIYVITFNKDMYKAHLLFPDFIPALNFPVIGDDWRRNFVPFTY